jgi:ribosomal-protein-alanine N-acetyltransferase
MSGYSSRALQPDDVEALLEFELTHKRFFEQSIEARPDEFYQPEAVQQHIGELLCLKDQALAWPALILNADHQLIGRANLKDIDPITKSAYVGYRIAENWSGQGVASFALGQLIRQAKQLGLMVLFACVATENLASMRVLKKAGFQHMETIPHVAIVQGKTVTGYLMWLKL